MNEASVYNPYICKECGYHNPFSEIRHIPTWPPFMIKNPREFIMPGEVVRKCMRCGYEETIK